MEAPWAPFCSQRCKDVDLGRWLRGDYRVADDQPAIPAEDADAMAEAADEAGPRDRSES